MTTQYEHTANLLPIGPAPDVPWSPEAPAVPSLFRRPLVVGHRGYPVRAPENPLAGIRLAVACGADIVEVDVHTTRDGVSVVPHDATLDRTTTGTSPVGEWTFDDLRAQVRIRGGHGEPVPTLAEVLVVTAGRVLLAPLRRSRRASPRRSSGPWRRRAHGGRSPSGPSGTP